MQSPLVRGARRGLSGAGCCSVAATAEDNAGNEAVETTDDKADDTEDGTDEDMVNIDAEKAGNESDDTEDGTASEIFDDNADDSADDTVDDTVDETADD
jgi:hypothetical protein